MEGKNYPCGDAEATEHNHKAVKASAQRFTKSEKMQSDYSIPGKKKVTPNGG